MELADFSPVGTLEALSQLLNPPEEEEEESNQEISSCAASIGPGHIAPMRRPEPAAPDKSKDRKEIWDEQEVPEGSEFDDTWDPREQPEYNILYKQRVGTEDVFLGMSRRDPSTACCEDMVVRIQLADTKAAEVSLSLRNTFLDLRAPKYKLGLHLPHPVDSKNGKAQFLSDREALEVTLPMMRDFDFINFL
ncbi:dynein axonemal assembly factor 6 isoform X2 [Ascaphus truei]|uniref:dynein axonemal assembly factor 6 isoform X2 n=1 Tax=Ascaphus truei TaxID=8439 RepID=UPI003F5A1911